MRRAFILIFLITTCVMCGQGQEPASPPTQSDAPEQVARPETPAASTDTPAASESRLPDSPGALLHPERPEPVISVAKISFATGGSKPPPCRRNRWIQITSTSGQENPGQLAPLSCVDILNPYLRFLDTRFSIPMTPAQKAYLAFRNISDPFNLGTIVGTSAFNIGLNSHTAYGPGWKGFGKSAAISLLQDTTGEFFGTFAIPSITHEDPHYHRMPHGTVGRRLFHAISRTVVAQHDDGTPMPNYSTLLNYPITAEISNLYVPGIQSDSRSTADRILLGYALDPVNNIITEFLPDLAKRVHIRIIFVQQILNQVVAGQATGGQASTP
jgi:hypothetical protein